MPTDSEEKTNARLNALTVSLRPWQREALHSLLDGTDPELSALIAAAETDSNLQAQPDYLPVNPEPERLEPGGEIFRLESLSNVLNVNQLAKEQVLQFGPKLTLIYGENASGKSGYVRILKSAFDSKSRETILPNAYTDDEPQKAEAIFTFTSDTKLEPHPWADGAVPHGPFKDFACFDRKAASMYLEEENRLAFKPAVCDALAKLAGLTDMVRDNLTKTANKLEEEASRSNTPPGTSALANEIAGISASTSIEDLLFRLVFTQEDASELSALEAEFREITSSSGDEIIAKYETKGDILVQIYQEVKERERISDPSFYLSLQSLVEQLEGLRQDTESNKKVLDGIQMLGIGGVRWKALIKAAKNFSDNEAYLGQNFPVGPPDGKCVLCLQPLNADAFLRLKTFVEVALGVAAAQQENIESELFGSMTTLKKAAEPVPAHIASLLATTVQEINRQLRANIDACFSDHQALAASIQRNVDDRQWATSLTLCASILRPLLRQISEVKSRIEKEKANPIDDVRREKVRGAIDNLKARSWGADNSEPLRKVHGDHQRANRIKEYCKILNTRTITIASKEIEKNLVTDAFEEQLNSELKTFRTSLCRLGASLATRPEKGEIYVSLKVTKEKPLRPEQIFSEGERTALALAVFFADVLCTPNNAGIIFDDPVDSLDHKISKVVAKRLVDESKARQVIVFTHSLTFYALLRQYASTVGVEAGMLSATVSSLGTRVGIIESKTPTELRAPKECLGELTEIFKEAQSVSEAGSPTEFKNIRYKFFGQARSTIERIVEDIVLNKVVTRRQDAVMTASLAGVFVDEKTVAAINEVMGIASANIDGHSRAPSDNSGETSINEMEDFLKTVNDLYAVVKQNRSSAEVARAPFKPSNARTW
jgi:hypothetical protein